MKTRQFCPAGMTINISKTIGQVKVNYISSHNHCANLEGTKYQLMPSSIRNEVKAKLRLGVPVNDVYQDMRASLTSRNKRKRSHDCITRAHLIPKSNITDMKRHMSYNRRLHPDDSTSVHLLISKLKEENYNPILVYKPQGQEVLMGPSTYNDFDLRNNQFVVGIQTKEQRDMFIKGAEKIVCIDSTHGTNRYAFPLTNIVVPDEFG